MMVEKALGVIYEDEIGKQHASRASSVIKSDEALSDVVAADAVVEDIFSTF